MSNSVIEEVFEKSGGRKELRKSLGLSKQSMSDWVRFGVVPVRHCPAVHRRTGIPLERLNPAFCETANDDEKARAN